MHDQKIVIRVFICLLAPILVSCTSQGLSSQQTADFSPHQTVSPAFTSAMTVSPDKTVAPQATPSLMPAIRKTPGVLDCADIVKAHSESTAADWEGAKILLRGGQYYYTGTVFSVTEHDEVHLSGSLCHVTLHHVPHEIAVNLSHGQFIEGCGTIASIGFNRGEDVDIEANPDLIFVR
jgi:hypothetical protein